MRKKRRSCRVIVDEFGAEDDLLDNVKKCKIADGNFMDYKPVSIISDMSKVRTSSIKDELNGDNKPKLRIRSVNDLNNCYLKDTNSIVLDQTKSLPDKDIIVSDLSKVDGKDISSETSTSEKCSCVKKIDLNSDFFDQVEEIRIVCKCGEPSNCDCDEVIDSVDNKNDSKKKSPYLHLFTEDGIVFVPCSSWSSVVEKCRGMYTMRMLEAGTGAADSDSAVSSMGSERVPSSTSDTDWMETNSDSGHTPADHFMASGVDMHSKLRWFDYNYCRQHSSEQSGCNNSHRMPPVAQKKYHLFGKRLFQEQQPPSVPTNGAGSPGSASSAGGGSAAGKSPSESSKFDYNGASVATPSSQTSVYDHPASPLDMVKPQPEIKYSCSLEFSRQNLCGGVRSSPSEASVHNHTYHLPPEHLGMLQRPLTRDKKVDKDLDDEDLDDDDICLGKRGSEEDISITRDERRARALNIPITVTDIINLPMDEFNERLSKFDLSESQLSLIRDIRRRGKNKVAAQNCRKRKLDQILSLADEVKNVRDKKQRLLNDRDRLLQESIRVKHTVSQLFRHIFQSLRDKDGNSYSPHDWSLEEASDGSIVLVPKDPSDLSLSRSHLPANSSRSDNDPDTQDLHQPSTSKKHFHPRKHMP